MSNFDFILNLDNSKRITNSDNNLCYDNSYISYFRNSSLEEPLILIRNTLLKKIIEKVNNCIDYCLTNLKNINEHKIYIEEEIKQINDLVEFIKNENDNINSLIQSKLEKINKNEEKEELENLENINEDNILLNENNSRNINEDNYSENNYSLCEKVFSIAIKIKNAIQTGFKVSYNFISLHSKNLINRLRN
jgi:hypothetical protein